jgi:serine phosphatase RsbU (regulator of sigma subunit)
MQSAAADGFSTQDPALIPLAAFLDDHAGEIVNITERAWESSILLFALLGEQQRRQIRNLAERSIGLWAVRLRQQPQYARLIYELGEEWGRQAAEWELHVYSFTKALDLLAHATWDYLATHYPMQRLSPATVFFLGRSRDQVLDDLRVPLLKTYLQVRESEMERTQFSLEGSLSLPGRSLLLELGARLQAKQDQVIPAWIDRVRSAPGATAPMEELLTTRGAHLVSTLLALLQSPTQETGAASLPSVQEIGLESAQAGVSFQEMFHALQQFRPILWDTVYDIYEHEQYWHPAEFIEAMARLHLLLDLFSEGIGQAYLRQKEMIIQHQADELRRRDLNLAREMLENLLPRQRLDIPHSDVGAVWIPSSEIGGDFYDVFSVDDEIVILIGDVSGKGISAALLVSMVKYVLKANAPLYRSPAKLLTLANRLFYQDMGPELFVTLFCARYNPHTGQVVYTSAGHDPCYICRTGQPSRVSTLPSQGPVLGVFPTVTLKDKRIWLREGDVLLLYTDGLVNVRCGERRAVNSRSLCGHVNAHRHLPAQELVQAVLEDTVAGCEPTDDITALILKRMGESAS